MPVFRETIFRAGSTFLIYDGTSLGLALYLRQRWKRLKQVLTLLFPMSNQSGADESQWSPSTFLRDHYHIPVLAALIGVMLTIRLQAFDRFVGQDGSVLFSANDPWYHYRETTYAIQNWPHTMPFDPWTGFPSGRHVGQFGTLWDQLVATVILLLGLGDPSPQLAGQVMLVATGVMASLVAIPTYLLARRFISRPFALFSIFLLALIPGQFLTRSLVGQYQHHAAETFFMTAAALIFIYAFAIATREQPIWELVLDRDIAALRLPIAWSILAGVALALYMYVWQPGVLLVGITGVFVALKMSSDVYHNRTPEPIAFVAAVAMTVTGLLMIIPLDSFSFGVTDYSYTQIALPLAIAAGAVFLAYLAREWDQRDIDVAAYPATVAVLAGVGILFLALFVPDAWSTIWRNLVRTVGFGAGAETRTIAEAQPMLQEGQERLFREYGLTFIAGFAGLLSMYAAPLIRSNNSEDTYYAIATIVIIPLLYFFEPLLSIVGGLIGLQWQFLALIIASAGFFGATLRVQYDVEHLYFLVWSGFLICAAFTQIRFNYYLVIPIVIASAYVVAQIITIIDLEPSSDLSLGDIKGWQAIIVLALLVGLVVPVLIVPIEVGGAQTASAFVASDHASPGEIMLWEDSLDWVEDGTPYPGEYGNHDNRMDHYGTFDRPDDDFPYDDGAYGIMAWWDYGHWITSVGERIAVANPFQQNARTAANFLLAPNEEMAAEYVYDETGEGVRYVMLDYSVAHNQGGKYRAPTVWYDDEDIDHEDLDQIVYSINPETGQVQPQAMVSTQRSMESMRNRLYQYHGSAVEPEPVVVRHREETLELQDGSEIDVLLVPEGEEFIEEFDTMEEARQVAEDDPNARIGGVNGIPEERIDALETYRLVHTSMMPANANPQLGEPHVKTFERVEGATIEGSGAPANTELEARVELINPITQRSFEYVQFVETDSDGTFELTVPYSTTGYDEYGTEAGYTDVAIQAAGPYTIMSNPEIDDETLETTAWIDQVNVTEGQVLGEDDTPVVAELHEEVLDAPEGAEETHPEEDDPDTAENDEVDEHATENDTDSESVDSNIMPVRPE